MQFDYGAYDFYCGIPSSALKGFIAGIPEDKHYGCCSEPEAVGMAAGAWMAGKRPCVYMQNDGVGRCLTDICTLLVPYGIEVFFIVGDRTDGVHATLGLHTKAMLDMVGWTNYVMVDER